MEPRIETLNETKLIGKKIRMSLANNKTAALWRSFSPSKKKIKNTLGLDLYSVEIYNDVNFFANFDPTKEFDKWAAVAVNNFDNIPDDMDKLVIPAGEYAVFHYRGQPGQAQETFQYIYGTWLPDSKYEMDERPYIALMGEKYKGEDPDSEEEFWVPIKKK